MPKGSSGICQRVGVLTVVANVGDPATRLGHPDRRLERLGESECLDRSVHALAAGLLHDLVDRIALGVVDDDIGTELLGELLPLWLVLDRIDQACAEQPGADRR
jgi:hypothetical protein